jgi:hypothetical protein
VLSGLAALVETGFKLSLPGRDDLEAIKERKKRESEHGRLSGGGKELV